VSLFSAVQHDPACPLAPRRCIQHWGLLHETQAEAASPFLEQLAGLLQQGLESNEDASAPADVAGVQCRVAARCVRLCVMLHSVSCCTVRPGRVPLF
jgi:hypothetical protein